MKFKEKIVECDPDLIGKSIDEILEKWITSLLLRQRVDPDKINKIQKDANYSKRAWRTHLFYEHGIEIIKHNDKITITKYFSDKPSIVLGEWRNPEIVRKKIGSKLKCELHLKYWQIV